MSMRWPESRPLSSMADPPRAALFGRCDGYDHSGKSGPVTAGKGSLDVYQSRVTTDEASRPDPRCDILLDAGLALRRHGPLVAIALLQPLPVGRDIGTEILGEPNVSGKPQRITVDDVGGGEAAGAQPFGIRGGGLHCAQPAEEPF